MMTNDVIIAPDDGASDESHSMKMSDVSRSLLIGMALAMSATAPGFAADYAGEISAYRRAHNMPAVTIDGQLNAFAMTQAQAMSRSGTVSHEVGGVFSTRVARLRKLKAAENIAAGFLTFSETLKQWEDSAGHRENLLMPGARKVGVAAVSNPASPYRKFWAMVITD